MQCTCGAGAALHLRASSRWAAGAALPVFGHLRPSHHHHPTSPQATKSPSPQATTTSIDKHHPSINIVPCRGRTRGAKEQNQVRICKGTLSGPSYGKLLVLNFWQILQLRPDICHQLPVKTEGKNIDSPQIPPVLTDPLDLSDPLNCWDQPNPPEIDKLGKHKSFNGWWHTFAITYSPFPQDCLSVYCANYHEEQQLYECLSTIILWRFFSFGVSSLSYAFLWPDSNGGLNVSWEQWHLQSVALTIMQPVQQPHSL